MMRPTRRALTISFVGVLVALLPVLVDPRLWPIWPLYIAALIVLFGFDALSAVRPSELTWELDAPDQIQVGDIEYANLQLHGSRRIRVTIGWELSEEFEPIEDHSVTINTEHNDEIGLRPQRRGVASIDAIWLRWSGPLGWLQNTTRIAIDRPIRIVPNTNPVRAAALRFSLAREFRSGMRIERYRGDGTEFDSLREYVRGDDHRSIDWKSSARHNKLMRRQFRAERNRQVVIALDTGHLMSERVSGISKLDHAISAALLLAFVSLRNGDRTGLYSFDSRAGLFAEPQSGMRAMRTMTEMTSRLDYSSDETNFTLGLTTLAQRIRRRSLVVVLTDFVDTLTAELMLENLGRLARRHLVVFVALRDPSFDRIARAPLTRSLDLHRSVVAHTFLREREVVMRRLQRLGILAIDSEPRAVGTTLINRYLEVKRRERV